MHVVVMQMCNVCVIVQSHPLTQVHSRRSVDRFKPYGIGYRLTNPLVLLTTCYILMSAVAVLLPSAPVTPPDYHRIISDSLKIPNDKSLPIPVGLLACQRPFS